MSSGSLVGLAGYSVFSMVPLIYYWIAINVWKEGHYFCQLMASLHIIQVLSLEPVIIVSPW